MDVQLKPDVKFTDGSDLTAEVVAYNFDYWVNNGGNSTALAWLGGYYESATAVDDLTLQVNLSKPYPRLADNLTQGYFGIQSQQALETRTDEENCEAPIGSGAFIVDHWDRGQQIVLKAQPRLHVAAGQRRAHRPGLRRRGRSGSSSPTRRPASPR